MTTLAERIARITTDLDCGLGDLDAVKCRLRDTLDVIADIVGHIDPSGATVKETHARVTGSAETVCGREITPGTTCFTYFTQGARDVAALNSVDCPSCHDLVLRWPEYHFEWERAASAHAKAHTPAPRVTPRQANNRLDGWRTWLLGQAIADEVAQEHLDDLARALAAVKRPP